MQAAHCKLVINRDVWPSNLMHTQSTIFLVDWGSATLLQKSLYEGTIHNTSLGVLQQPTQDLATIGTGPADDLESLVASMFCVSHPDAHQQLQRRAKLPASVMQWWTQTWISRPQCCWTNNRPFEQCKHWCKLGVCSFRFYDSCLPRLPFVLSPMHIPC